MFSKPMHLINYLLNMNLKSLALRNGLPVNKVVVLAMLDFVVLYLVSSDVSFYGFFKRYCIGDIKEKQYTIYLYYITCALSISSKHDKEKIHQLSRKLDSVKINYFVLHTS